LGVTQPGTHTFRDQRSLELGHGADNLKHQAPAWRGQIDVVLQADEGHAAGLQFDGNRYCAPPRLVGQRLIVKADASSVALYHRNQEIALNTGPGLPPFEAETVERAKLIRQEEENP
jgi:hypothetical protein